MKKFNIMYGVGKTKYLVNYHDGVKTHNDGSEFYDIATFKNQKKFQTFIKELRADGYTDKNDALDHEELPEENDSISGVVFYARKCAREAGIFLAEKTDEEIILFALSYLGANIDDAIESGLAEVGNILQ